MQSNNIGQYDITLISHRVSAGDGADITNIEVVDTEQQMSFDKTLLKTRQKQENLRIAEVNGDSMIPKLYPDSFVIFDITKNYFDGDGLYVVLWRNIIMVKLLQGTDAGNIEIVSINKNYKSYIINPDDDQSIFKIVGKVIRAIV